MLAGPASPSQGWSRRERVGRLGIGFLLDLLVWEGVEMTGYRDMPAGQQCRHEVDVGVEFDRDCIDCVRDAWAEDVSNARAARVNEREQVIAYLRRFPASREQEAGLRAALVWLEIQPPKNPTPEPRQTLAGHDLWAENCRHRTSGWVSGPHTCKPCNTPGLPASEATE